MNIPVNSRHMSLLECFGSETRVRMIELLGMQPMNIKELADTLELSSAIITKHIQKLEENGIVGTESISGTRGRRKVCYLIPDSIVLQLKSPEPQPEQEERNGYAVSIPVGQYERCSVKPTCGLASESGVIGMVDDPRYFSDPEHVKAKHLWFASGFIEYRIPNYLVGRQTVRSFSLSLEICSEAPGYNEHWPSDITFSLVDTVLGTWTCPGDFGSTPGVHTPKWWNLGTQHGLLKTVTIDERGTYLDGVRLSGLTSADLAIGTGEDLLFRIACPETAEHPGGVSLFGRHFGHYDQEIEVRIRYEA
ncbi:ArsR/SmtB family transcription factor [Paenibacillus sp. S-38]|uniref:ArsR/SmtB family transcription factor n=1 Tax=Paenibacillus sp. S-38 TaxID=3416710 RepID=UPI003CF52F8F